MRCTTELILFLTFYLQLAQCLIFPCYYFYAPGLLSPESVPVDICTHIIFLGCVSEDNLIAERLKTPYDCSYALKTISKLKEKNKNLTVILSMGGNDKKMHEIVQNATLMKNYVNSVINLAKKYNYDGIDFDWEFPCEGNDRYLFTDMLELLRSKIGNSMLVSAAIAGGVNLLRDCYDLNGLSKYLDYINVMCYNYNTIYNKYTAYSSPLFARPEETGYDATLNTNYTINYLLQNNVPKHKIVVGMSVDGHTFQLENTENHGFHANVSGIGIGSGWTYYPQLCEIVNNGGIMVYDEIAEVVYAYKDDQWLNTNDVRSGIAKAKWVKQNELAGIFTWSIDEDDLYNVCWHGTKFPVHKAIRDELFS